MKSLEDEERFLLERREVFEEDLQMRKSSHSRTTERHRDSTGERRKSGRRIDSEEKLRRDSSEGKNISRTSRSQSSERILEGKSSHSRKSSESRSASSERILKQLERLGPSVGREPVQGIYVGEYQNQSWVFVGEITSVPREVASHERRPLQRSASQESTASEKDFSKAYQAITHRMVHRKSSAIMYSRILERTFECNKTVLVHRFVPFFSNTDSTIESLGWGLDSEFISHFFSSLLFHKESSNSRVGGEFGFRIHGSRPVVVSAIEQGTPAMSSGLRLIIIAIVTIIIVVLVVLVIIMVINDQRGRHPVNDQRGERAGFAAHPSGSRRPEM